VTTLATIALALAALYAFVTLANLAVFRVPQMPDANARLPGMSVLVPARNEAGNMGPALDAILACEGVELEALVLDDGSTDGTGDVVAKRAARDRRVRLIRGESLPPGWNGKQHACWQLARAARHPILVFIDADVRLAPECLARVASYMELGRLDLASGFPRQRTETLAEMIVIPQIFVLLLGYLPLPMARLFRSEGFAAGCGQMMAVRRSAYHRAGGHAAIRTTMHDGLRLPRLVRASGGRTDILDATPLATCRMYASWSEIWAGFAKNATEGMAKPVALPIWTVLLGGGHILPYFLVPAALMLGDTRALALSLGALGLLLAARLATALVTRHSLLSIVGHPVGIAIVLAIQWSALANASRGRRTSWRGRSYDVG
jgi:Glycosyl transferase family 2